MGFDFNPTLWFVCRLCQQVFANTEKLKNHKLENHLGDCLRIQSIIFEEKFVDCGWTPTIPPVEFQNPYVSLTALTPQEINLVMKEKSHRITVPITDSPVKEKTKNAPQSNSSDTSTLKIPEENHSVADSRMLTVEPDTDTDEDATTVIPPDTEAHSLLLNSHQNHFDNALVLEDGNFIVASIETCADGTGLVQFESTELYKIELTDANEDLNCVINESHSQSQNQEPEQINCSSKIEVESISNDGDGGADTLPFTDNEDEEGPNSPISADFPSLVSNLPSTRHKKYPRDASLSQQQQPKYIKTYSKSNPIVLVREDTILVRNKKKKNQRTDPNYDQIPITEKLKLKCTVGDCSRLFAHKSSLYKHKRCKHSKELGIPEYACPFPNCTSTFGVKQDFIRHSLTHPETAFNRKAIISNYLKGKNFSTLKTAIKCTVDNCTRSFDLKRNLWKHKRYKHFKELGTPEYPCPVPNCTRTFGVKDLLSRHIRSHSSESNENVVRQRHRNFMLNSDGCDLRLDISLYNWLLQQRMKDPSNIIAIDPDPTSTNFQICDFEGVSEGQSVKCLLCQESFISEISLRNHVLKCWKFNTEMHRHCLLCNKTFAVSYSFRNHNIIRHPDKPRFTFKCRKCPKEFLGRKTRRRHEKIHELGPNGIVKDFLCANCGGLFRTKKLLRSHMRTHSHSTITPWKCTRDLCNAAFKKESLLNSHIVKCHEPPYFTCRFCGKSYSSSYTLKYHERTHTDELPYKCDKCDKVYAARSSLATHRVASHRRELGLPEKVVCPFPNCTQTFATSSAMKRHARRKHSGNAVND